MICKETALLLSLRQRIFQRVSLLSQRTENEQKALKRGTIPERQLVSVKKLQQTFSISTYMSYAAAMAIRFCAAFATVTHQK